MSLVTKRVAIKKKKIAFQISEEVLTSVEQLQERVRSSDDIDLHLDEAIEGSLKKLVAKANKELDAIDQPEPVTKQVSLSS